MTLQTVYAIYEAQCGEPPSVATRAEYERALASLTSEWQNIRALPVDIDYYSTMWDMGVIDRQVELIMDGKHIRGSRVNFRLKDTTK